MVIGATSAFPLLLIAPGGQQHYLGLGLKRVAVPCWRPAPKLGGLLSVPDCPLCLGLSKRRPTLAAVAYGQDFEQAGSVLLPQLLAVERPTEIAGQGKGARLPFPFLKLGRLGDDIICRL